SLTSFMFPSCLVLWTSSDGLPRNKEWGVSHEGTQRCMTPGQGSLNGGREDSVLFDCDTRYPSSEM
ncbi:hypothetical protein JZ751_019174, partial [Albula glossodonta]